MYQISLFSEISGLTAMTLRYYNEECVEETEMEFQKTMF